VGIRTWTRIGLRYFGLLVFVSILLLLSPSPSSSFSPQPPKILDPKIGDPPITGIKEIKISAHLSFAVDIYLFDNIEFLTEPCYIIEEGVPVFDGKVNYSWESYNVVDHDGYFLIIVAHYSGGSQGEEFDSVPIATENGKIGEVCRPPEEPSVGNGSSSDGSKPPPSSNTNPSNQTTSNESVSNTDIIESSDILQDSSSSPSANKEKAIVVFDEEIPITLERFDPDIFLKGGEVEIKEIKSIIKEGPLQINFSGTAPPNSLVTLYVFTNPVIVVLQSDSQGNWSYDREKKFDTGKHIAFATIYQEKVTRRSSVVNFFVAQGTSDGQSLILSKSSLQRLFPYAGVLGGAIIFAILILTMYRIYSNRKQIKV